MTQTLHLNLDTPLNDIALVFFDVETTGLQAIAGDRICELALLRCEGQVEVEFETLVNSGRPLSPGAFAINGISAEELALAPSFAAVVARVLELLDGAVLVAHNASFDSLFLNAELERLRLAPLELPVIDTLPLARRLLRRSSYSLAALAASFGISAPTHRAMDDVRALKAVFDQLQMALHQAGVTTLGGVLRFQRGLRPDDPEPEPPALIVSAMRDQRRLRLRYAGSSAPSPTEREVRPLEVTVERGSLCLRAFCYLRNDVRTFIIDRIVSVELI